MSDWVFGMVAGQRGQANETPEQAILRRAIRENREQAMNKSKGEPDYEEKRREFYGNLTQRDIDEIRHRLYYETIYGVICACACVVVFTFTCVFIFTMVKSVNPADKMAASLLPAQCTLNEALGPYVDKCVDGPSGADCMIVTLNFTVVQNGKFRIALFDESWSALGDAVNIAEHFGTTFIPGTVYQCFTDGVNLEIYIPGVESKRRTATILGLIALVVGIIAIAANLYIFRQNIMKSLTRILPCLFK